MICRKCFEIQLQGEIRSYLQSVQNLGWMPSRSQSQAAPSLLLWWALSFLLEFLYSWSFWGTVCNQNLGIFIFGFWEWFGSIGFKDPVRILLLIKCQEPDKGRNGSVTKINTLSFNDPTYSRSFPCYLPHWCAFIIIWVWFFCGREWWDRDKSSLLSLCLLNP